MSWIETVTHPISKPPPGPIGRRHGGPDKPIKDEPGPGGHGAYHPPSHGTHPVKPPPFKNAAQQSAWDYMNGMLKEWGLGTLGADLRSLILKGDTNADTLTLKLADTHAYKVRFSGNAERIANGYAALKPADYLAMEAAYRSTMSRYGLPAGFYDNPAHLAGLIGKNLSVSEIDDRAKIAHDQYENAPSQMKQLWTQYFGKKGDMIAYLLDPTVATEVLKNQATQIGIGYGARKQGLSVSQARAAELQSQGVTSDQADKAYAQIKQSQHDDAMIAGRFDTTFDQHAEEQDLLLGDAEYANRRAAMYGQEKALFQGGGGLDQNSLGVSQEH